MPIAAGRRKRNRPLPAIDGLLSIQTTSPHLSFSRVNGSRQGRTYLPNRRSFLRLPETYIGGDRPAANAGVQRRAKRVRCNYLFGGVSVNSTVVQLTQSKIPARRKHFQLPSGIFLCTPSTLPRRCAGVPPGDVTNEAVYGRHSTSQPPSRKIISLYSGT